MATTSRTKGDRLSPYAVHRRLMQEAPMALRFSGGALAGWKRQARAKLQELLGVPANEHRPMRARSLWSRKTELGTIEKLVFESEPGADVPVYWCVPHGVQASYTTFICLQGHSTGMHNSIGVDRESERKEIKVEGDRDFALGCMRRGIAALCIEQRSLGTRGEKVAVSHSRESTCHDAAGRSLLLGRTLIGERVFDVDRAIDYLAGRGDVDMNRLGIMGNSGGGTISLYAGALLPRLAYCMPSCAFAAYADSIGAMHHCACNYVPRMLEYFDMGDVAGLIAPRPLVIVSGLQDDIFPVNSARRQFRQTRSIYAAAGAGDRCRHVIGQGGHRFYADLAWGAMRKLM